MIPYKLIVGDWEYKLVYEPEGIDGRETIRIGDRIYVKWSRHEPHGTTRGRGWATKGEN